MQDLINDISFNLLWLLAGYLLGRGYVAPHTKKLLRRAGYRSAMTALRHSVKVSEGIIAALQKPGVPDEFTVHDGAALVHDALVSLYNRTADEVKNEEKKDTEKSI